MFRRVELGNFKRFQSATIDLKKINVIVGPNNSGKSSIIGALRLICQTLDSHDDQVTLLLNGPFGDFGTFKDLIYRNHRGRPLEMAYEFNVPNIENMDEEDQLVRLELVFKYSQEDREVYAQSVKVFLDKAHLISTKYLRETQRFSIEKIGSTLIPSALKSYVSKEFKVRHFFPFPIAPRLGMFDREKKSAYGEFLVSFTKAGDNEAVRKLGRIWNRLFAFVGRTDYLGPLRVAPSRTYLYTGERSKRIGISGENLTSVLAVKKKARARPDERTIQEQIDGWLQKSEMAKAAALVPLSDRHFEIRIHNFFSGEDQNIADVGYGHSQVLPFLAGGLALPRESAYLVEQPELHLHPRAQAELGDYLLQLYERSVQTIVETHSEHLILRVQQHVAAGNIKPEDVQIFYVSNSPHDDQGNKLEEITSIALDRQGQFKKPWPKGFFPEKLNEAKKLARIRLQQQQL